MSVAVPFGLMVARGSVEDMESHTAWGRNLSLGTIVEDLWDGGGLYIWPTTAGILRIKSAEADDAYGGAGCQIAVLYGLDENLAEISESVQLNGTTFVSTVNKFFRVRRLLAYLGTNVGAISAYQSDETTVAATMLAGLADTQMAMFTVPAGKRAYMVSASFGSASNKIVHFFLTYRLWLEAASTYGPWLRAADFEVFRNTIQIGMAGWPNVPERTDIALRGLAESGGDHAIGGFTVFYETDEAE